MAMQYDVKAMALADGDDVGGPVRLKGAVISYEATGTIQLTDGVGGAVVFEFTAPSTTDGVVNVIIPGEGIRCFTNLYAEDVTSATITVFYG